MSIFQRIILIFRGYLSATNDRLERIAIEEEAREAKSKKDAAKELDSLASSPTISHTEPVIGTLPQQPSIVSALAADYKLLGLSPGADIEAIESAWRELARRADPKRFPPGSAEEKRAAEILRAINEAYARIREAVNPTEGRFGKLEL